MDMVAVAGVVGMVATAGLGRTMTGMIGSGRAGDFKVLKLDCCGLPQAYILPITQ